MPHIPARTPVKCFAWFAFSPSFSTSKHTRLQYFLMKLILIVFDCYWGRVRKGIKDKSLRTPGNQVRKVFFKCIVDALC